ncbi:hypothetical protein HYP84_gp201 [Shigella phage MK-13]|uniref:Uncharacterized protein n=1 Tax=Shigella phage MK-13 TaxID=2530042 RepID=A0A513QBK3_9CAUD|nr:hypothetical protein HYP84_gp201 [Shigella phage MK-13]QBJ04330.1 hypothetical protein MK13_00101 [Shigella phage MK-13]
MANKPTQPVFPLGLVAEEQSTLAGILNTGTIEHGPDAVLTLPEGNASAGLPSSVRYNADSDEFEGFYENGGWLPLGGGGIRWEALPHASTATLTEGRGYLVDNSTGVSTVVFPSPTRIGDSVTVCDLYGKFSLYPLTIDPNGRPMYGSVEPMTLSTDSVSATFTWSGDARGWIVTAGVGLGQGRVYSRTIFTETVSVDTAQVTLTTQPSIVDVYVDGKRLLESKYSLNGFNVDFSPSIPSGSELQVIQYVPIQLGNGSGGSGGGTVITWIYNSGSAAGGETEIELDVDAEDVSEIFIDGSRQQKGLGFTYDSVTKIITLADELEAGDEVVVVINGDPTLYNQIDRTPNEVARSVNVPNSQVILSSDTITKLDGKTVIYDVVAQKIWSLPSGIPTGSSVVSVSGSTLTYAPGNVVVSLLLPTSESLVVFQELLESNAGVGSIGGVAVELGDRNSLNSNQTVLGRIVASKTLSGIYNKYSVVPNTGKVADGVVLIDRLDGNQLEIQFEDYIDVRAFMFGAMTDQETLQAALDYADSVSGHCVIGITPKNKNGDPWVFTHLHIGSKTIVKGAGGWLKFADNVCNDATKAYYLVENFDAQDTHLIDLYIDGNQASNTLYAVADILTFGGNRCSITNCKLVNAPDSGLMFATTKNCWVNGLYVENTRDLGIYLSASVAGGTRNCAMSNLVLRDCAQGAMGFKRYVADIVVDNVVATNCGNGITFEGFEVVTPGMNPSNITMSNIRLRDIGFGYRSVSAAERALSFDYARGIRISNLSVQNCSGVGIFFSTNTSTGIYINGANLTGYAANPQIASGVPNNDGIQCNGASGFELINVNLEGFARYAAWFLSCSGGSVVGGRWTNTQASGYNAYNGARVNAACSFTKFSPEFISGASGTDLEWFNGATGITKDTILNNATGPAKYGYVVVSGPTPVATVTPRFIGQEVWSAGASSWWKSHGLTSSDWKQMSN